jgi:hypothetical protein
MACMDLNGARAQRARATETTVAVLVCHCPLSLPWAAFSLHLAHWWMCLATYRWLTSPQFAVALRHARNIWTHRNTSTYKQHAWVYTVHWFRIMWYGMREKYKTHAECTSREKDNTDRWSFIYDRRLLRWRFNVSRLMLAFSFQLKLYLGVPRGLLEIGAMHLRWGLCMCNECVRQRSAPSQVATERTLCSLSQLDNNYCHCSSFNQLMDIIVYTKCVLQAKTHTCTCITLVYCLTVCATLCINSQSCLFQISEQLCITRISVLLFHRTKQVHY